MRDKAFVLKIIGVSLLASITVLAPSQLPSEASSRQSTKPLTVPAAHSLSTVAPAADPGTLPVVFEENRGQADPGVRYLATVSQARLFLMSSEAVLATREAVVRMRWNGANLRSQLVGIDPLEGKRNYLGVFNSGRLVTDVATFGRVQYRSVYHKVDLVFHAGQKQLEYDWVVRPGGDPSSIRMQFIGGARGAELDNGDLVFRNTLGEVRQRKPVAYQIIAGTRHEIETGYLIERGEIRFKIGPYERSSDLVIDPVIVYAAFVGGSGAPAGAGSGAMYDQGNAIAVDSAGNTYVAGTTYSPDFPLANSFQSSPTGRESAFVFKLNAAGTAFVYSTYFPGAVQANAIAVDGSGNVVVVGSTNGNGFPTVNPAQAQYGGGGDAFVAKLNPSGSALLFSTYLGGSGADSATAVAVDSNGSAYVAGYTGSSTFPVTQGSYQTKLAPGQANNPYCPANCAEAFVSKLGPQGSLIYSTYLGGSNVDNALAIAVGAMGNAFITGTTTSTDFPVTPGAFQTTCPCNSTRAATTAFVAAINAAGSGLIYSTFLGGNSNILDEAFGIAVDSTGSAYVTGSTLSRDFPTTQGAFQTTFVGGEGFVTKLNPQGTGLVYSTLLSGTNPSDDSLGHSIAVDAQGNATVVGFINGVDFPVANAIQSQSGSCGISGCGGSPNPVDAFVARLNNQGSGLVYSTYFGGTLVDEGLGVALDASGDAYVTGQWGSGVAEFTPAGLVQAKATGGVFVLKIAPSGTAPQITSAGIADAASYAAPPPVGGLATVFGVGLSGVNGVVLANSLPLPTKLAGVSVFVAGVPAPILAVANVNGQEQINFQIPTYGAPSAAAGVSVDNNGSINAAVMVANSLLPGVFTVDGVHAAVLHTNYIAVTASNPAAKGEVLLLFATGLGPVSNDPGIGNPAQSMPLSVATATPSVTVQGLPAAVSFAGLAPGFVGLNQVNFQVPAATPSGDATLLLSVAFSGATYSSSPVKLTIQ